jgi:CubicO group peptidase (beta-lactamase class C family)
MRQLQWDGICGMTDRHFRYALGLFVNSPPVMPMGPNAHAFGHAGAGGSLGFADPENGIAFSYSPNFMCAGAGVGDRCPALIDAVYA